MSILFELFFLPYAVGTDIYTAQLSCGGSVGYAFLRIVINDGDFSGAAFKCAVVARGAFIPFSIAGLDNVWVAPGAPCIRRQQQDGVNMAGYAYQGSVCHGEQLRQNAPRTDLVGGLPGFPAVVGVRTVKGRVHLVASGTDYTYNMSRLDFDTVRLTISLCVDIWNGIGLYCNCR